ncbi:tetratricopeptide repeat protein [Endozoicomonas sp. G2_2]|uniref:L,D-transpeptidase Cds6 family protein n=1 Tax=Endozoicomonas sp. G2_2 TaxID=2821092 RepID=UPI001ADB58C6|nr:tetratricopeptide repeat protein [Endozoicomonas sp. G2_2]MBO9468937.1 tetratricopeptide repeat protein [Endozoicomonas sp. G2_2]
MTTKIKTTAATALIVSALAGGVAHADMDTARQALSNNDFPAAVEALDEVLAQSPNDAEARFLKGLALARSGDTGGALDVFNALVKNNPDMAEAWNNLGVLRARDNDLAGAQTALEKAVEINPEHGPAQENLGDIYVAMAQTAYSRAGELESDNAIARAKSQQLAEFIGGGMSSAPAAAGQGTSTPPAVPNVTRGAQAQVAVDTSTPQATLQTWAKLWSAQDVRGYLSMYGDAFVPSDGMSRSAWAAQRRDRVGSPARIDIGLSNTRIDRRGEQALVTFTQRYESNTYQDEERKALLMGETADGWQILREGGADEVAFTVAENATPAQTESVDSRIVADDASGELADTPPADAEAMQAHAQSEAPPTDESASQQPAGQTAAGQTANNAPAGSAPAQMQAESQAQARQAVERALQDWAAAWAAQDVGRYLNAYSDNYKPRGGVSLSDWVRGRRQSVSSPAWIKVEISDLQVSLLGDDRAQANFNQHYHSNTYEDRERKRVTLVREDGGWRIVRES